MIVFESLVGVSTNYKHTNIRKDNTDQKLKKKITQRIITIRWIKYMEGFLKKLFSFHQQTKAKELKGDVWFECFCSFFCRCGNPIDQLIQFYNLMNLFSLKGDFFF